MSHALQRLPPEAFAKIDPSNDDLFYADPRLVTHIDQMAISALTLLYEKLLAPDAVILDLMSSWVSHLPPSFKGEVIGHGMNRSELDANPQLARFFVQNLNADSELPIASRSLDGALCCAGVQYLARPGEVFDEMARVLRPGAPFIISFSNRCFPTKAVAVWRALDAKGHGELVALYLRNAGFKRIEKHILRDGAAGDPLTALVGYL